MKQFIELGGLLVRTSNIKYIDTERKRVYLENKDFLDYTGELDLKQFEEADPTEKMFEIIEKAKEEAKKFAPTKHCEVDIISTFTICELVEELNRREGVERRFILPCGEERFEVEGPGIVLIIKD